MVFVKGCPMRCPWCSNPETQGSGAEVMIHRNLCMGCGTCAGVCPPGALKLEAGKIRFYPELCTLCGACFDVCPTGALENPCRTVDEKTLTAELLRDSPFFRRSGGGVTFSGGEPLRQAAACRETAARLKAAYVHTALETTGCGTREGFRALLEYIDLVLFDLKLLDPGRHLKITGADNALILDNAKMAAREKDIIFRIPLIPGYTETEENLTDLAAFIKDLLPDGTVHLLPFHSYGAGKYAALGRPYKLNGTAAQTPGELDALSSIFTSRGLNARIV